MPCFRPISGYRGATVNPETGKRPVVFNVQEAFTDLAHHQISLPCGRCIGCRLERSRQWAIRCVHEASLYEKNCFITLTYNDKYLPKDGGLCLDDYQRFMKRLRKRFDGFERVEKSDGNYHRPIRFFHCGEYGEQFARPHYHSLLFNFDFDDRIPFKKQNGSQLYISPTLDSLWRSSNGDSLGFATVGDVTFESAAYVARYITKKVTNKDWYKDKHGEWHPPAEMVYGDKRPEYVTMSRRPGIGKPWLDKWLTDVYPDDFIVIDGRKMKPPKYYDVQFEVEHPNDFAKVKAERKKLAKENEWNNDFYRLQVREKVTEARMNKYKRSYENG